MPRHIVPILLARIRTLWEGTMAKAAAKSRVAGHQTARSKTPAKRRAVTAKPAAKPKRAARKAPQKFTVSHARDAEFKADGLRPYARYRDLGIAAASNGLCQAHVIRMIPPVTDEVRKRHYHDTELQLIYVLKGWMKNEFEGHGEQLMEAGSCWLQPPKIKHTVLDYSDDLEVLEIIVPANFKTVDLTK
jgi:mannose-6-phosphate isomerase-like protein (cupin superfamily)